MELEFHQMELRHADLRIEDPARRRRLLAALAEQGQQVPVVVIAESERFVLIDGYLRVGALQRLGQDTVKALEWSLSEVEALVHRHHLSSGSCSLFEQAWLLCRLHEQGLGFEELGRRFCRSKSWVSRRLALVKALPDAVQDKVRQGIVPGHAATKYLVPLARANKRQCEAMVVALGTTRVTDREVERLYAGWRYADAVGRARLVEDPLLYLRAMKAADDKAPTTDRPGAALAKELAVLSTTAWRARERVRCGLQFDATYKPNELSAAWLAAQDAFDKLATALQEAFLNAGSENSDSRPQAT